MPFKNNMFSMMYESLDSLDTMVVEEHGDIFSSNLKKSPSEHSLA
jgi:hypothetical protein